MEYIVCIVGGALAALAVIGVGCIGYLRYLASRGQQLQEKEHNLKSLGSQLYGRDADFEKKHQEYMKAVDAFKKQHVQYVALVRENESLKQDLFNLSVKIKKMDRDQAALDRQRTEIDEKSNALAQRYLLDNISWLSAKLNPNNYSSCKNQLQKVFESCRSIGFDVPQEQECSMIEDLKRSYEQIVRQDFQRQEQVRIRAQIHEEEKLAREAEKLVQQAEREQEAVRIALEIALAKAEDEHGAEIEHLKARLLEAQENAERAKSRAQMTRSGHVYVISNVGSFGENVYKIGMSRRLEPLDRVKELGDASVPFPFDVHMMISSDDAPTLENALHRELHKLRLNKVNLRKEFFRVDLDSIRRIVEEQHGKVDFVLEPEAEQYRESLGMSNEDYEFVEQTVLSAMGNDVDSLVDE